MRTIGALVLIALTTAGVATPQGRPVDWPSVGGDARRTGWEKSDVRITKDNLKDFQLVLKRKLDGPAPGASALTPPVVIGLLISYKGFKELGFVSGNSGDLWAIDLDLNRPFWHTKLDSSKQGGPQCAGMATAPALTPPAVFGRRPGGPRPAGGTAARPKLPERLGGGGFGGSRSVYALTGDGMLHMVNSSDGSDQYPALKFLPANARPSSLLMTDNTVYAMTNTGCGGAPNALHAIDLAQEETSPVSFALSGAAANGTGGFAVGNDGTVYVQTGAGTPDPAAGKWGNTLIALTSKKVEQKDYFLLPQAPATKKNPALNVTTPVVFELAGRDVIATAAPDGRIYLLDSKSLGGADHKTPLAKSAVIPSAQGGFTGGLSSWEDADGARWIAAPVSGALNAAFKPASTNGATPNGSIITFRVEEKDGKAELIPAWVSRDLKAPVPPVITSGALFALSTAGQATLYGLDAATGKELYSTGNQVTAPGSVTGLTVANGRVFFTTTDNTLYGFGIFLEI
ncbi:PQQ-binding-like beta-propeller repeat protein [uncultured Paludibaculum sp.]|uniref:outer membrane protein assembly factor BamB family protein n=1 Tax=uncultured Paludibaculum sp. TaxID=1765020 RepID=UPI002AAB3D0C|nr:PQQ-binding-like beta-propeller repeat protein [uncultured Paludibaculum sp.]